MKVTGNEVLGDYMIKMQKANCNSWAESKDIPKQQIENPLKE